MLDACGVSTPEELFAHLPEEVRLNRPLNLAPGISEYEIVQYFRDRAAECANGYASFLGAGVYNHFRPVLVDTVVSRGEFLTSYTPYQAEIAQGTLTTIFEFQTMICQLTGMDVANASMYDGSTAVPEAAMMAVRATGKGRVLIAKSVHPEYREVLATYAKHQGMPVAEFGYVAESGYLDLEDLEREDGRSHRRGDHPDAELLRHRGAGEGGGGNRPPSRCAVGWWCLPRLYRWVCWNRPPTPISSPGELQSFAISPSYGGPYAGILAIKEKYIRQMPGRLVGQSTDSRGNRAFCLTLSTREQHIRREKATSNICTNQALIALMATVFMTVYGKQGLRELAEQNLAEGALPGRQIEAALQRKILQRIRGARRGQIARGDQQNVAEEKIIGGLPLGRFYPELADCMLLCATETTKRADMDTLAGHPQQWPHPGAVEVQA